MLGALIRHASDTIIHHKLLSFFALRYFLTDRVRLITEGEARLSLFSLLASTSVFPPRKDLSHTFRKKVFLRILLSRIPGCVKRSLTRARNRDAILIFVRMFLHLLFRKDIGPRGQNILAKFQ